MPSDRVAIGEVVICPPRQLRAVEPRPDADDSRIRELAPQIESSFLLPLLARRLAELLAHEGVRALPLVDQTELVFVELTRIQATEPKPLRAVRVRAVIVVDRDREQLVRGGDEL